MKNSCFWTVVLEKTLRSPLGCKEIQPVCHKGNQSWIFIGRTDAEAAIPQPPDVKHLLFGKDPEAGKDWRVEEKGMTEDKMVRWHHRLDGHMFEQVLGVGDGQGSLACCRPWVCKESGMTEWLNWTETTNLNMKFLFLNLHSHIQVTTWIFVKWQWLTYQINEVMNIKIPYQILFGKWEWTLRANIVHILCQGLVILWVANPFNY